MGEDKYNCVVLLQIKSNSPCTVKGNIYKEKCAESTFIIFCEVLEKDKEKFKQNQKVQK